MQSAFEQWKILITSQFRLKKRRKVDNSNDKQAFLHFLYFSRENKHIRVLKTFGKQESGRNYRKSKFKRMHTG